MSEKNVFQYSYSAKQQEEVESIKKKYLPKDTSDKKAEMLEELRRLDKSVEFVATIAAIVEGVIGTLIFGTGMSLILAFDTPKFVPGLLCGLLGMAGIALALPVYRIVLKIRREKVAPRILELSEELLKN